MQVVFLEDEKGGFRMIRWMLLLSLAIWFLPCAVARCAESVSAMVGTNGRVHLARGRTKICELSAGLFNAQWAGAEAHGDGKNPGTAPAHNIRIAVPGGGAVKGVATITGEENRLKAEYVFTPEQDSVLNSIHISAEFGIQALAGGTWTADDKSGTFPADFGEVHLINAPVRSLKLELPSGEKLEFAFAEPTPVLLQDNRKWGPSFSIRIHRSSSRENPFKQGAPVKIGFSLAAPGGITVEHDSPVTIVAGSEWIPLNLDLVIEPGSALDFSALGLQDAPAGKHGWLQAKEDGTFRFEKQPDKPVRFYGVNFCFSALYVTHEQADRIADRLAKLGYNTVRVHHYEGELTKPDRERLTFNEEKLDQLDYLLAACMKRGLYITTDLFVSRPVDLSLFVPDLGSVRKDQMNGYKALVPINEKAWENWCAFTRKLMTHVNPYTQRAYKDEPGFVWFSLINEGNLGNFVHLIKEIPDYRSAWNKWLAGQYRDRAGLAAAWGGVLKADEDPARGNVVLDGNVYNQDARGRDLVRFLSQVDADFVVRATKFLRGELGMKGLITNLNAWTNPVTLQAARAEMDYVDDHFYVDHPHFLEQDWRLPSRCPNTSPVAGGANGGRGVTFTRLFDKPYTLSEYNYSAPGRYRGVGGILTGAMGAIEGWGVIWRFAYSHDRRSLLQPGAMNYFDMSTDPLGQAAERASICLFTRGDMRQAPHGINIVMTPDDLAKPPARIPFLSPAWNWAAWITRVGTQVVKDPAKPVIGDVVLPLGWATPAGAYRNAKVAEAGDPYQLKSEEVAALLKKSGILKDGNPTDPGRNIFQCETGEIAIDAPRDTMTLDTPRTAGGFAPAGEKIVTRNGVEIAVLETEATVWVSALDDRPIVSSKRLLISHLTDLQNTEIRYAERARQTLLAWGRLPHLVRAGKAEVRLKLKDPAGCRVWALSTSGKRVAEVPANVDGGALVVRTDVAGFKEHGAILCYEVARE